MAGDWIKIEHATLDKPEIGIAAEMLGISDGEAFFLFVRYWVWIDQNLDESLCGLVRFVSRKSLERKFRCPGFASVLEKIGWAEFDDETQLLTVKNWERHNGKSAKSRALEQRRMARNRSVSVRIETAPEKRREDIKSSSAEVPVDNFPEPETWTDHWQAKGKSLGIKPKTGESMKTYCDRVSAFVRGVVPRG